MKRGFTLIELLVVVLIIGILSSVALPQYTNAVEKARTAEAVQNISMLEKQLDLYLLENGYPNDSMEYKDMSFPVDLAGGTLEGNYFYTKFFSYYTLVSSRHMEIEVVREKDGDYYTLLSRTDSSQYNSTNKTGNWYRSCVTQTNDFGRKICKQLESQGWTYADLDY